jgi:hypothetical protein
MSDRARREKTENIAVYGIFATRESVERAVARLRETGFRLSDVSVLFPSPDSPHEFAVQNQTKGAEGAAVGATSGGIIGGALGWLAGIGAITIPGAGPFVAAGPIMAMLAGVGTGGIIGGVTGVLIGLGIPEYEARRYEGRIKDGGILLSVHCDSEGEKDRAREILDDCGATDISASGEWSSDYEPHEPTRGVPF